MHKGYFVIFPIVGIGTHDDPFRTCNARPYMLGSYITVGATIGRPQIGGFPQEIATTLRVSQ